eukprot:s1288_g15.t1
MYGRIGIRNTHQGSDPVLVAEKNCNFHNLIQHIPRPCQWLHVVGTQSAMSTPMLQRSPLFGGTPGLEPVALRIARINEDLAELQDMLEVAMRDLDSQQAEAALELQRLRVRLLDGLCPAKLRQSERVKRLAKRLARLELNVGREQTECVRVMEAVLSTVERNGAVAEAVCQHLGTRRALGHGYQDEIRERGLPPSAPVHEDYPDRTLQALRAEPSWGRKSEVIDEHQGDAGKIIEEAEICCKELRRLSWQRGLFPKLQLSDLCFRGSFQLLLLWLEKRASYAAGKRLAHLEFWLLI